MVEVDFFLVLAVLEEDALSLPFFDGVRALPVFEEDDDDDNDDDDVFFSFLPIVVPLLVVVDDDKVERSTDVNNDVDEDPDGVDDVGGGNECNVDKPGDPPDEVEEEEEGEVDFSSFTNAEDDDLENVDGENVEDMEDDTEEDEEDTEEDGEYTSVFAMGCFALCNRASKSIADAINNGSRCA